MSKTVMSKISITMTLRQPRDFLDLEPNTATARDLAAMRGILPVPVRPDPPKHGPDMGAYTIRLADPGQPARVYLAGANRDAAIREARVLGKGVLAGGTVQVYRGLPSSLTGDEDPIVAWTA